MVCNSFNAKIPKEAFLLTNSLSDLWNNGETEKAIETSLKLFRLYPPFFIERIHNTLAQQLQDKDRNRNGSVFLKKIYFKNNKEINKIIRPIFVWDKVLNTNNQDSLAIVINDFRKILKDSSNYKSQTERYGLLILKELDFKKFDDSNMKKELLLKIISNLESYPYIKEDVFDRKASEIRAWNRYLLAYSYYCLYSKFDKKEEYLLKASDYSPDENDQQVKNAYFYDAALLTGNVKQFGYKEEYLKYLKINKKTQQVLNLLTEITFNEPTDIKIKELRNYYNGLSLSKSFNEYWFKYINLKSKSVPQVIQEKGVLDLSNKHGAWIFIDIWGTWCSPCRKELPDLQALYVENSLNKNSKLQIYTFSYNSQGLSKFMKDNKYSFPVVEIDKQINDAFNVLGYPTKILITPEGNYLKIPFNVNWKMYIRGYCLM